MAAHQYSNWETIERRRRLLALAAQLGNVAQACREMQISRAAFYRLKRRFEAEGDAGLADRSTTPRNPHPLTTPPAVVDKIVGLSLSNPAWGCCRMALELKAAGLAVSSPVIQKLLIRRGLGKREDRVVEVERSVLRNNSVGAGALAFCERIDPRFRERQETGFRPGRMVVQDTVDLGNVTGAGPVFAQIAVDTFSCWTWVMLHPAHEPRAAVDLLRLRVEPQLRDWGLRLDILQTPSTVEYYGRRGGTHNFHEWVDARAVHQYAEAGVRSRHGFIQAAVRDIHAGFCTVALDSAGKTTIDQIQTRLDAWLDAYHLQPIPGWPLFGRSPSEAVGPWSRS